MTQYSTPATPLYLSNGLALYTYCTAVTVLLFNCTVQYLQRYLQLYKTSTPALYAPVQLAIRPWLRAQRTVCFAFLIDLSRLSILHSSCVCVCVCAVCSASSSPSSLGLTASHTASHTASDTASSTCHASLTVQISTLVLQVTLRATDCHAAPNCTLNCTPTAPLRCL